MSSLALFSLSLINVLSKSISMPVLSGVFLLEMFALVLGLLFLLVLSVFSSLGFLFVEALVFGCMSIDSVESELEEVLEDIVVENNVLLEDDEFDS